MWVCECVIELDEGFSWEKFVDVFECMNEWLEFADDVIDMLVEFEVVLELESEDFGSGFVFEGVIVNVKFDIWEGGWVEGCIGSFGRVGNKVVVVEVGCEFVEVVLSVLLEGVEVGC